MGTFVVASIDFRFAIQVAGGSASDQGGNIAYTHWASEGGGWSGWAEDADQTDFNAVRVKIETRLSGGLVVSDLKVGAVMTDNRASEYIQSGRPQFTQWLNTLNTIDNTEQGRVTQETWCQWASDQDWHSPD